MADIQRKTLNLSADNLEEVQSETVRLQKTEYQNVCKKLAEEREMLSQYSKHIGEVVGKQFVKLVFCFCGDSQGERIKIGYFFCCYACFLVSSFHVLAVDNAVVHIIYH